jgi:hypothetical protein
MISDDQEGLPKVDGILLYKDTINPNTFYYSSTRPSIGMRGGGFEFTLLQYLQPIDGQAAVLSFVVDLEPSADDLKELCRVLQQKTPQAKPTPIPWTSGTVAATIINGTPVHGTPSLIGRNSAVISVGLSDDQLQLLKTSVEKATLTPISVVYNLSHDVFRKAYEAQIIFDQEKFLLWLQKKLKLNLLFISFEKTETFEELKTSDVIKVVSIDMSEPEVVSEDLKKAFLRSLQGVFTAAPSFAPHPDGDGQDSWGIGFENLTDLQKMRRQIDCDMRISGAVSRTAVIQGSVDNLAEAYRACKIQVVPYGARPVRPVVFRCETAFDDRPVTRIQVSIDGKYSYSHEFDRWKSQPWTQELTYDSGGDAYTYRCEIFFGGRWSGLRCCSKQAIPLSPDKDYVDIVPSDLFDYRRFDVLMAKEFPWTLIKKIEVKLLGKPGTESSSADGLPGPLRLFQAAQTGQLECLATRPGGLDGLEYSVSYLPAETAMKSFVQEGLPAGSTIFLDPLRRRPFHVQVDESFDWTQFPEIMVALSLPQGVLREKGAATTKKINQATAAKAWDLSLWSTELNGPDIAYTVKFTNMKHQPVTSVATRNRVKITTPG